MVTEQESEKKIDLLDDEGDLTEKFREVLKEVFGRFSSQAKKESNAILSEDELDEFAKTVNEKGKTLTKTEKEEIREYFEVDKEGNLTFNGFCEMYHLQTSGQIEETWKDLKALGYDDRLNLITNRE